MEVGTTPTVLAGRYRVLDRLGTGGMATVFLAEDERLGRKVAVKRLHADSPEDAAQRFEREAKVGASLSHPNLVTVFDTVADEEGVLIVMEYVEGENLAQLMARERLSSEQAVDIIRGVAGALDHAHQAGVVHRDVKPANILVSPDGKPKLVDLGIATATERTQITAAGTVLGTPSYMAPEQLEGRKVEKAVDIYALGAVAFELLSGRKARRGRTPVEIAHQIATGPPPDLREAWVDAPPAAAAVLERAMARDPAERPATAGELARGLREGLSTPAPPPPAAPTASTRAMPVAVPFQRDERPRRAAPARRRPATRRRLPGWIPFVGTVLALLVAIGAIVALTSGGSDKATAPILPAQHEAAKPKQKKSSQQAPAQSQTQTTPAAPAGGGNDPAQGAALHAQAHNLINQGRYDQAIALEQQAVKLLEGSGRVEYWYALYDLGHALRLAGHPDQAIPVLEKRLQNPNQRGVVQAELDRARAEAAGKGGGKAKKGDEGDQGD
ncbi:MAG: protein kinase domain-containing protein [Thermoleophilaceae bacterium]